MIFHMSTAFLIVFIAVSVYVLLLWLKYKQAALQVKNLQQKNQLLTSYLDHVIDSWSQTGYDAGCSTAGDLKSFSLMMGTVRKCRLKDMEEGV